MLGKENIVCKLVKSLYRLKKAPKQWHQKFDVVIFSFSFKLDQWDKCIYNIFNDLISPGVIICLCVDEMLIFGTDQDKIDQTRQLLSSKFSIKDLESLM